MTDRSLFIIDTVNSNYLSLCKTMCLDTELNEYIDSSYRKYGRIGSK